MQIKENAISMFPYGTSSLSSLPGFRELCWASSVCSKHRLAFCFNSPPFREVHCEWSWLSLPGWGKIVKMGFWHEGFCQGQVLSCLYWRMHFAVYLISLEVWTVHSCHHSVLKSCLSFEGCSIVPAAAGSCSVLFPVLAQAGYTDNKSKSSSDLENILRYYKP